MSERRRSVDCLLLVLWLVPVALSSCTSATRPPLNNAAAVPTWAVVSREQIVEAAKLGVPVAYPETMAGLRFVLIPGTTDVPTFYLSTTETTNAQFRQFRPKHVGRFNGDDQPVDMVRSADVLAFAEWLSGVEKSGYRLPTETEWEHACRAGTMTSFWFGDRLTRAQANFNASNRPVGPAGPYRSMSVGSYPPNSWGLFDMHGNSWEWCSKGSGPTHFAIRGGSWRNPADQARSGVSYEARPDRWDPDTGFRIARDVKLRDDERWGKTRNKAHHFDPTFCKLPPPISAEKFSLQWSATKHIITD